MSSPSGQIISRSDKRTIWLRNLRHASHGIVLIADRLIERVCRARHAATRVIRKHRAGRRQERQLGLPEAVIQAKDYERSLKFFEKLVADHPNSAKAHLNYGFAYVDKIPAAGSITQVILANTALTEFTRSIDISPSWIAYYTRGNSYLFWPKVFRRAPLGVADLEKAYSMQKGGAKRTYHVRVYISLGDGYWKTDNMEKARAIWTEGLREFPDNAQLKARLARNGDDLKTYIDNELDPNKRVDTNLQELWASE